MALPVAITCGDPAGVGPELIQSILSKPLGLECPLVVIGPRSWLTGCSFDPSNRVECVEVEDVTFESVLGEPTDTGARVAINAMEIAAEGCLSGRFAAVVTGPISKANCVRVGYQYPGQTEFFAARWGGQPSMGFVGECLKVILATWHIPLKDVASALDRACIQLAVQRAYDLCKRLGIAEPRIAVCGLNPHAGEEGILGNEELELIDPLLDELRCAMPGLSRCLPGDTVFGRVAKGEYDVAVAMYHDQGLAPLKTVDFDTAVNVSLGLPYVRTSPDHGTAYDIAGKGLASANSFRRAIVLAAQL